MRRICTFVELFKFFLFLFGFAEGSMCVFCQQIVLFSNKNFSSRKKHSLDVNSDFFLSKSHQKNKRVYDDRF